MLEQLVEAWRINHRVTLKLLDALSDDALKLIMHLMRSASYQLTPHQEAHTPCIAKS